MSERKSETTPSTLDEWMAKHSNNVGFWRGDDANELWIDDVLVGWVNPTYENEHSRVVAGWHAYLLPDVRLVIDRVHHDAARRCLWAHARKQIAAERRSSGRTLSAIGNEIGVSKQRVLHQILTDRNSETADCPF